MNLALESEKVARTLEAEAIKPLPKKLLGTLEGIEVGKKKIRLAREARRFRERASEFRKRGGYVIEAEIIGDAGHTEWVYMTTSETGNKARARRFIENPSYKIGRVRIVTLEGKVKKLKKKDGDVVTFKKLAKFVGIFRKVVKESNTRNVYEELKDADI